MVSNNIPEYVKQVLGDILPNANHVDIKTAHSESATLREMIAGVLNYQPAWMTALYRIRWGFVRLIGVKQEGVPSSPGIRPEELALEPGGMVYFFETVAAEENCYWIGTFGDSHLEGHFAIVVDPNDPKCFHGVTVVHYRNWAGPVYFNVIRPFHHLVVYFALKSAAKEK